MVSESGASVDSGLSVDAGVFVGSGVSVGADVSVGTGVSVASCISVTSGASVGVTESAAHVTDGTAGTCGFSVVEGAVDGVAVFSEIAAAVPEFSGTGVISSNSVPSEFS